MMNRKEGTCCRCEKHLAAGEGNLFHVQDGDEFEGFGPSGASGWFASCIDTHACDARRDAKRKERGIEGRKRTLPRSKKSFSP